MLKVGKEEISKKLEEIVGKMSKSKKSRKEGRSGQPAHWGQFIPCFGITLKGYLQRYDTE